MIGQKLSEWTSLSLQTLETLGINVAMAAGAAVLGVVLARIVMSGLHRWLDRDSGLFGGKHIRVDALRRPVHWLLPGLCLSLAMPYLRVSDSLRSALLHATTLWIIAAAAGILLGVLAIFTHLVNQRYAIDEDDNLRARQIQTKMHVIQRLVGAVIVVLTVAVMLMTFDQVKEVGVSLLASAGVLGIILGMAAQRTVGSLFAGLQIALTQPIRIDDVVIVEGEWGRIEEITLTYVVVRIWDQRRLVLPITYFIEKPFQNWTRTDAQIIGTVFAYVDYTLPVDKLRSALEDIVREAPDWDERVFNVQVTGADAKTMEVRALVSAADSGAAWNLRCHVREKLIAYLQETFSEHLPRSRVTLRPRALEDEREGAREDTHENAREEAAARSGAVGSTTDQGEGGASEKPNGRREGHQQD